MKNEINIVYTNSSNIKGLDFSNENAKTHRELARRDLVAARALFDSRENSDDMAAIFQNVRKTCMTVAEHSMKAILYADVDNVFFTCEVFEACYKNHENNKLQKEQQEVGINILEPEDIAVLDNEIDIQLTSLSCYTDIRYKVFDFDEDSVKKALDVAEKAYENLETLIKESRN